MLFAEIDADGWVKIIGAFFGGIALVALPILKLLLDLRRDLKVNTSATLSAADEAGKASKRASVAAQVGVNTAQAVAEQSKATQEIKKLVNGAQDAMKAKIASYEDTIAALEAELAKYQSPRP